MIEVPQYLLVTILGILIISITNHYDKYLVDRFSKDFSIGILLIFSAFIGLPAAALIFLFGGDVFNISAESKYLLILSGILYIISLIPYMYALSDEDVSNIMPAFLIMPPITYALSYFFLGEILSNTQILGIILVVIGILFFSGDATYDEKNKLKVKFRYRPYLLIFLSAAMTSGIVVLFKYAAINDDNYYVTIFWNQIGYIIAGVLLFLVPTYRNGFIEMVNSKKSLNVAAFNAIGEIINLTGDLIYRYALLIGTVTIVQSIALGFQPIFVFLLGLIFTIFLPWFSKETITSQVIIKKTVLTLFMAFAILLMEYY